MKVCENGVVRDMTGEEMAVINAMPVEPTQYDEQIATFNALRLLFDGKTPTTADERIQCGAIYPEWAAGNHNVGEIYNALGQVWECYQAYDNAIYTDVEPHNAAWHTFNRPLHGTTPETAREFVQPTGAHNTYKTGEYAIYNGKLYKCIQDTAYSPDDYVTAWEN